jgi:hypothetical protein
MTLQITMNVILFRFFFQKSIFEYYTVLLPPSQSSIGSIHLDTHNYLSSHERKEAIIAIH